MIEHSSFKEVSTIIVGGLFDLQTFILAFFEFLVALLKGKPSFQTVQQCADALYLFIHERLADGTQKKRLWGVFLITAASTVVKVPNPSKEAFSTQLRKTVQDLLFYSSEESRQLQIEQSGINQNPLMSFLRKGRDRSPAKLNVEIMDKFDGEFLSWWCSLLVVMTEQDPAFLRQLLECFKLCEIIRHG
jgi:hypothetical protein